MFCLCGVQDFLPHDKAAVVVDDFPSVEMLAKFLKHHDNDDDAYSQLLAHKINGQIANPKLLDMLTHRYKPPQLKYFNSNRQGNCFNLFCLKKPV